jgi:hypothetical protein
MGRKKIETPAICPFCKTSFDHVGKDRYHNLKRHIETVHPDSGFTFNIETLNNYTNCMINPLIFANMKPDDILKLMTPEFMAEVNKRLDEGGADMGLFLFSRLRCDPKNPQNIQAVIPNLNKNQMKVKIGEEVLTTTKKEGARMLADSFFENDVPPIQQELDDPVLEMSIDFDKKTRDKRLEPGIISKLENLPTETRKNVNRHLNELPQGP